MDKNSVYGEISVLLLLNSLSHLLVDGLCAAAVFGRLGAAERLTELILLYNTLAFSTQCLAGLAADRIGRHGVCASASMLLVALGYLLPLPALGRIVCIGLGNSVFHVAGGSMTLERSMGRAGRLGVFVAPGAVGLALGTMRPRLGVLFALLALPCALAIPAAEARTVKAPGPPASHTRSLLIPLLLAAAVAIRAVGGAAVSFPWQSGTALTLLTVLCVAAGKALGGFVCDRLGPRRTALLSVIPAALAIAFCSGRMLPSLAGQLALNLSMPVTLWLMYRAMPEAPGFAFGLAASALWPGTIAGRLMILTGPALRASVLLSFLFGLWAILYAERRMIPDSGEETGPAALARPMEEEKEP